MPSPPQTTRASTPSATHWRARSSASSASRPCRLRTPRPGPAQPGERPGRAPAALALARRRVRQERDLAVGTRADYRAPCGPVPTAHRAAEVPNRPEAYGVRAGGGADGPGETADGVEGGLGVHPRPGDGQQHARVVRRRPVAPRRTARPGARARGSRRRRPARGRRRRRRAGRRAAGRGRPRRGRRSTRCPVESPRSASHVTSHSPSHSGRSNGSTSSYDGASCGAEVTAARPRRPPTGRSVGCALPARGSGRGPGR